MLGYTALHAAAAQQDGVILSNLIKAGASINNQAAVCSYLTTAVAVNLPKTLNFCNAIRTNLCLCMQQFYTEIGYV